MLDRSALPDATAPSVALTVTDSELKLPAVISLSLTGMVKLQLAVPEGGNSNTVVLTLSHMRMLVISVVPAVTTRLLYNDAEPSFVKVAVYTIGAPDRKYWTPPTAHRHRHH
jgi:hypothetical protein